MKKIVMYECEKCLFLFRNIEEAIAHEARHFSFTVEDLREWDRKYKAVVRSKNEAGEVDPVALEELKAFEKSRGLASQVRPYSMRHYADFYD